MAEQTGSDLRWLASLLGLNESELRAFRFLHETGGAGAGAVAAAMGLPRGRIYDVLRSLAERGLVRELPGARINYAPAPLSDILASLRVQVSGQLRVIDEAGQRIADAMPAPMQPPARMRPADVSVVRGRRAAEAEIRRLLDRARARFLLPGARPVAQRIASQPATLAALEAARARGVHTVFYLPDAEEENVARSRLAETLGTENLHLFPAEALPSATHVVSDAVTLQVIVQPMDASVVRGDDVGIRIESLTFADATRQRFDQLRPEARATGPTRLHGADAYVRRLGTASQEVLVLGPVEWMKLLEAASPAAWQNLRNAQRRGIRLRAIVENEARTSSGLEGWELQHRPAVPFFITIIDRAELHQAYPATAGDADVPFRVSRDPDEIRYWIQWFERWWREAPMPKMAQP